MIAKRSWREGRRFRSSGRQRGTHPSTHGSSRRRRRSRRQGVRCNDLAGAADRKAELVADQGAHPPGDGVTDPIER